MEAAAHLGESRYVTQERRIDTLRAWAVKPSFSASRTTSSAIWFMAGASNWVMLPLLRKLLLDKPAAQLHVPPVGSTWLGPAA